MKIFCCKSRKIVIVLFIVLVVLMVVFMIYFMDKENILLEDISCNSVAVDDYMYQIRELTKGKEKVAYLTFDDGPNISVTPKILDILKLEDVKATFFVIGKYVEAYPEIVKRAYEEGHYIANHGYDHNNKVLYKSEESFINEIKKTDIAIGEAIGVENYCSHLFRFPNGFMAPQNKSKKEVAVRLLKKMNYTYIDWNCLNHDSVSKYTSAQLLENLKKTSKNKGTLVILMHDTKDVSDSSTVLQDSIDYLKSQGYQFDNFYHLIQEEANSGKWIFN